MPGVSSDIPAVKPRTSQPSRGSVHLDALRGAAAMIVFLNHTRALYFSSFVQASGPGVRQLQVETQTARGEITLASEAVVIFFVLSGYLVGGSVLRSLQSSRWSWADYLTKRLTRLLVVLIPALVLGASLDYLGMSLFGSTSVYGAPLGQAITVTWHLAEHLKPHVLLGNVLFLQGILVPEAGSNVSLWSLANEFWYYIAFPLLALSFVKKMPLAMRIISALAACAILAFTGFEVAILFPLWLLGALIAALPQPVDKAVGRKLAPLALLVLLAAMLGARLLHLNKLGGEYLVGIVSSMLLYTLIMDMRPSTGGIYHAVSTFFSKISYTLYCFHLPLAVFLCGMLNSPWQPWAKTPRNLSLWLAGDILILLFAWGLWRLFEANTDTVRTSIVHLVTGRAKAA